MRDFPPHFPAFQFLNVYPVGSVVEVADYKTQGPEWVIAFGLGGFTYVGIKVLRLRFIISRLTGAGSMSVPNLPFTSGIIAVRTRKSALPSSGNAKSGGAVESV